MDSVYNNTFVPLNSGQIWEGRSESISKFTVASVSCITDVSGILNLYFALDNVNFDFVKIYQLRPNEPFIINQKVEGKYFKVKVTNNSEVNQTYLRLTTTYKEDIRSDLDIRPLNDEKDAISIPALNACITDGKLNVNVEGVTVTNVKVDISGQRVVIDGETVKSQIYDYNNYAITSQLVGSKRGLDVNNIGTVRAYEGTIIKEVGAFTDSHNKVNLQTYDDALNDKVNSCDTIGEDTGAIKVYISNSSNNKVECDISGQRVLVDISGQMIDISGQRVLVDISGQRIDISGQTIIIPKLNKIVDSIDISGQRVDISGQRVDISGQRMITDISGQRIDISGQRIDVSGQTVRVSNLIDISGLRVDISGQRVVTDISGQRVLVDISGQRVDISGQRVLVDISGQRLDISGQRVDISGQRVDISGQMVDISGQRVDISGQRIDISGQRVFVDISGQRVDISGQRVDISGQRIDITGQTLNVNTISGFALESGGNLASIKTNSDKLKYVGDDLKTVISNTSFESKLRDGNNNIITSTVYGIDGVRGLDVSIKNATQAEPLIVEIPTTNVVTTTVDNFPASYPIDAGGALSSATGALYVNLRDTTGNAYGVTGAPLVVSSNLITGFALESGGNLASIKTNSDKFKFTGDYLKTEVVNAGTNSLSVTETNPITGYALETGGNLALIKTNTDKNNYDASGNLKVNLASGDITVSAVNIKDTSGNNIYADLSGNLKTNIQNSSLDVHCYGSSDGTTTWHHLLTNPNGKLQTNAGIQDNNGDDITSTLNGAKQSLDVNVANTGALKVDISGSTIVDGKLAVFDGLAYPFIERISIGAGADIFTYTFGNFLNNTTINTGAVSTTITFGAGSYGRRVMLMYRDGATSSTDSITYYTDSNYGTIEPLLLQTVYPIVNNGYRWSNVIINILPFTSLKIRNDSTTINNTNVYLTVVRV